MNSKKTERLWDKRFVDIMQSLAPGTPLRDGLDNILRAKMGALVVVGDNSMVLQLVDGGFELRCDYSPEAFYEAAKMDGALVLSSDAKRILYANAQLVPDSTIVTCETGTRHRTAERVARQTGTLTIAISQRRNLITVYLGNLRYILKDIPFILSRSNQALQTLDKYKNILGKGLNALTALEFEGAVTLADVAALLVRAEQVNRIAVDIARDIIELGNEGRLVSMQMEELIADEDIVRALIRDYCLHEDPSEQALIREQIASLSEDYLETYSVARILCHNMNPIDLDQIITPRGYRTLGIGLRLPEVIVRSLVKVFPNLSITVNTSLEDLSAVDGVGEVRAKMIKDGLKRLCEQALETAKCNLR